MKPNALLFCIGGAVYPTLEVLTRGRSDVSMGIAGGLSMCLIHKFCNGALSKKSMLLRCCAGSGIITSVEFVIGLIVNRGMRRNVWDYSAQPLNVMGQVCLPYSGLWAALTLPAMGMCRAVCSLLPAGAAAAKKGL